MFNQCHGFVLDKVYFLLIELYDNMFWNFDENSGYSKHFNCCKAVLAEKQVLFYFLCCLLAASVQPLVSELYF